MSRIVSTSLWSNKFNELGAQMDRGAISRHRDRTLNTKGLVDLFESQDSKIIEIINSKRKMFSS